MSWQDTFSIDIKELKASPDVLDMTGSERAGFLWLVMSQWDSSTGYLPADEDVLRKASGLGDEWFGAKRVIMAMFKESAKGLANPTVRLQWEFQKDLAGRMADGARRAVEVREAKRVAAAQPVVNGAYARTAQDIAPQKGKSSVTTEDKSKSGLSERNASGLSKSTSQLIQEQIEIVRRDGEQLEREQDQRTPPTAFNSEDLPRQENGEHELLSLGGVRYSLQVPEGAIGARLYATPVGETPTLNHVLVEAILSGATARPNSQQPRLEAPIEPKTTDLADSEGFEDPDDDEEVIAAAKASAAILPRRQGFVPRRQTTWR